MSKVKTGKKLLEFGLKEADAFQKNFKIIFDRLVRGYRSMMGKDPEGLDLLKVKMEAREKAINTTKIVNQKGLTLDPDKPIVGGTQEGIETIKIKELDPPTIEGQMEKIEGASKKIDELIKERDAMYKPKSSFDELENFTKRPEDIVQDMVDEKFGKGYFGDELDEFNLTKDDPMGDLEKIVKGEGDTGLPKGQRPFGDNIRDAYSKAGRSREDATEMIKALDSPGAKKSYEIMEESLGVRLYGDETFEELMQIKETGVHPRGEPPLKKADGGKVPAASSQLVSESDIILGYRGPGGYQGGRNDDKDTASDTGPGGGATDTGPSFTGDSISGGDVQDLGFIDSGPTVNPNLAKKGPNIISAPFRDPRFAGYRPSSFDPGNRNIFQKGFDLVKRTVTNPFVKNLGFGILGGPIGAKFGLTRQIDMFNKARAIKGLIDNLGPMGDVVMEEDLETIMDTDVTGQTTALYKDGGLVTLFREKR